jgi:plasmid stabilization system protein ParE
MMRVRWTTDAADDLASIVERIRENNSAAYRGRVGLADNTRELVFPPWPYIAVYEIMEGQVQILRIRHASQDWP